MYFMVGLRNSCTMINLSLMINQSLMVNLPSMINIKNIATWIERNFQCNFN